MDELGWGTIFLVTSIAILLITSTSISIQCINKNKMDASKRKGFSVIVLVLSILALVSMFILTGIHFKNS